MRIMKKVLKVIGMTLLLLILGIIIYVWPNLRDHNRGYKADLKIISNDSSSLSAGFAAVTITPDIPDRWVDSNNDAQYNPKDGDTFTDGNGNEKFDAFWIAGFDNRRAANGIHDDLWARTMIIDDGKTRIAIVALDIIGFMNNEVIDIRSRLPESAGISYLIVASTHTHEAPDLLGLWGKSTFKSGVNPEYLEFIKKQIVKSVETAASNMRPARLEISEDLSGADPFVADGRLPDVFDNGLRLIKVVDKENGKTLGSLIAWANHPEVLWSRNLLITSDFPHFLRDYVEKGLFKGDSLVKAGIGGIAVYINGAIGGLMTTDPDLTVKDPLTGEELNKAEFRKADAVGKQVALLALNSMERPQTVIENAGISIVVRTLILPIDNVLFRLGDALGVFHRGMVGWMNMRSELAAFNIGPLSFITLPGELYPEILNGGITAHDGGDFNSDPVETPPLRDLMTGKHKFMFGLANDEIGYIIPKSQWDVKPPFAFGRKEAQYGEENSLGPETGPILHQNLKEMLLELNQNGK